MASKILACLERLFVGLLAATFAVPLALAGWLTWTHDKSPAISWLRNASLVGVQVPLEQVSAERKNVLSARFQAAFANWFDHKFPGREFLIRTADEIYLRMFHLAPVGVLIGPQLSLIEPAYCEEYCLWRPQPDELRPLVEDLRRMQDFCDARGVAFALVITPSKAAIYPENLPVGWLRRYDPRPRGYDQFTALLREKGIRTVDGHRLAAEVKQGGTWPAFNLGGIHWSDPAALRTANALLAALASAGLPVEAIQDYHTAFTDRPTGQDNDMANILNTLLPPRYRAAVVDVQAPPHPGPRHNIVLVGGSFVWKLIDLLDASHQFSEIEFYRYYKIAQYCEVDGELHTIADPAPKLNFETDVFAADALVLEINEQALQAWTGHLATFLHDALAVLPDPHGERAPFHYESRTEYRWGDPIHFGTGPDAFNAGATHGFAPANHESLSVGDVGGIRLTAPPPPQDMVLTIEAGAFVINESIPEQRVGVTVNGHPVGEFVWRSQTQSQQELTIPRELLSGGTVDLDFHIGRPASPQELGLSSDSRKFGILVTSLRLHAAGQ